jgi:hypothetical protein
LLLVAVALGACASGGTKQQEALELPMQRFTFAADTVRIYDLVGEVRIDGADSGATVVEVTRSGRDAEGVRVDTASTAGTSSLVVRFPGNKISTNLRERGSTRVVVTDEGRFDTGAPGRPVDITTGRGGLHARADVIVRVPRGKAIYLALAVGRVAVSRVNGSVRLSASTADVNVDSLRGTLAVALTEGNVRVTDVNGTTTLTSTSAPITIAQAAGARTEVTTESGDVRGTGIDAAQLVVRTQTGPVQLTTLRSAITQVESEAGRVGISVTGTADSLLVDTQSGDISLALVGGLRSVARLESTSGSILVRVAPAVGATVELEGQQRAPSVELSGANLQRAQSNDCAAIDTTGTATASCYTVRGAVGGGGARIVARSRTGDVRIGGY